MSERWDICVPEKSKDGDRTYWTKIGVMFRRDKGRFVIHMAYPQAELYAFEPQDQERGQRPRQAARQEPPRQACYSDEEPERTAADEPPDTGEYDDIPF